jgi:SAM-dependent methyltransferase
MTFVQLEGEDAAGAYPLLYHAHHSRYPEDLPFWLALAKRHGSPILELGCGSGRVLIPLAESGQRVFGLDRDPTMLSFLRTRLPAKIQESVHLFQADLTQFSLGLRFALILLPCNTLSTLTSSKRVELLNLVRFHLLPQGLFAASIPNPVRLAKLPTRSSSEVEDTFVHPLSGNPVQVSSEWRRERAWLVLRWHYDHLLSDGKVERLSVETRHALTDTLTYCQELASAGLEVAEQYGDFDQSEYTPESPYWIFTARCA